MKRLLLVGSLFAVLACAGCADRRAREASNLNLVKAKVALKEFNAAPTPEAKNKIAKEYFDGGIRLLQVVDDYLWGREPVEEKINVKPD